MLCEKIVKFKVQHFPKTTLSPLQPSRRAAARATLLCTPIIAAGGDANFRTSENSPQNLSLGYKYTCVIILQLGLAEVGGQL